MNITEKERIFLEEYKKDPYVEDNGWDSLWATAWVDEFCEHSLLNGKTLSGVFSSLYKKGIIHGDDSCFGLTSFGIQILKGEE